MTRRYLGIGLGLLASAFFVLALTDRGPTPALQVARFHGGARRQDAPRRHEATRLPATAGLPQAHHYLATWQRRSNPRSQNVRVERVSADQAGRRSARVWSWSRERHLPLLLAVYYDANAPPALVPTDSGRHS
jgi:hypothetical protein